MLVAGPNLTLDRTVSLDELRPGEVLRFDEAVVTPGGKGVNVARTALALGAPATLVGFTPGHTGAAAAAMLADEDVALAAVRVGGEIRSTAVILERSGRVTVMNEPGPSLGTGDWDRFEAAVAERLAEAGVLACSGSLPPGAPPDAYARLAGLAERAGLVAIVDVTGAQLRAALDAGASVVTPNLAEAEGLLHGRADETVEAGEAVEVRERARAGALAGTA
jgi:fructose-1-phosphate kinase PfkB-like protein